MNNWNPAIYKTQCCNDFIFSRYSGHFSTCKCGKSSVDDTFHYGRRIGYSEACGYFENYIASSGSIYSHQQTGYMIQVVAVGDKIYSYNSENYIAEIRAYHLENYDLIGYL